jgi:hypothetical protein
MFSDPTRITPFSASGTTGNKKTDPNHRINSEKNNDHPEKIWGQASALRERWLKSQNKTHERAQGEVSDLITRTYRIECPQTPKVCFPVPGQARVKIGKVEKLTKTAKMGQVAK